MLGLALAAPHSVIQPPDEGAATGTATEYADDLSLREARALYFAQNEFGDDGGYSAKWVKLQFGPIPVFFPNSAPRVKAVRYHDLHHVLTGYSTTNVGEAEIGAWEVATGCKNFWAAWVLNLMAMSMGLVLAPGKTARAFYRGRHSKNLYGQPFDDALLDSHVGEQREQLELDEEPPPDPTTADRLALALAYACGAALSLSQVAALGLVAWLVWRVIF